MKNICTSIVLNGVVTVHRIFVNNLKRSYCIWIVDTYIMIYCINDNVFVQGKNNIFLKPG